MERASLTNLAMEYFRRRGYRIKTDFGEESSLRGASFSIWRGEERYLVWVKEWRRTVGVNVIINIDRISSRSSFDGSIIVADKFSDHAKAYANRRGIKLLTRTEIRQRLR